MPFLFFVRPVLHTYYYRYARYLPTDEKEGGEAGLDITDSFPFSLPPCRNTYTTPPGLTTENGHRERMEIFPPSSLSPRAPLIPRQMRSFLPSLGRRGEEEKEWTTATAEGVMNVLLPYIKKLFF